MLSSKNRDEDKGDDEAVKCLMLENKKFREKGSPCPTTSANLFSTPSPRQSFQTVSASGLTTLDRENDNSSFSSSSSASPPQKKQKDDGLDAIIFHDDIFSVVREESRNNILKKHFALVIKKFNDNVENVILNKAFFLRFVRYSTT